MICKDCYHYDMCGFECCDDVRYNEVCVDIDSYPKLKISGRKSWAHNKYRLVTHLRLLPEASRI